MFILKCVFIYNIVKINDYWLELFTQTRLLCWINVAVQCSISNAAVIRLCPVVCVQFCYKCKQISMAECILNYLSLSTVFCV